MEDMIPGYQLALEKVQKAIKDTQGLPTLDRINQDQLRILREMERDLLDTLKQLRHEVSTPSPMSKRSKEQREVSVDPQTLDRAAYISTFRLEQDASSLTFEDRRRLYRVLQVLTPLEREIIWLNRGQGFTCREIASMLQLKKNKVKKILQRAEKKAQKKVKALKTAELWGKRWIDGLNKVEKSS